MQPIVNGLETEHGEQMMFISLNANEGDGEDAFGELGLQGHPIIVIFDADGKEQNRFIGEVDEATLAAAIVEITTSS